MLDRDFVLNNRKSIEYICTVKNTKVDLDRLYAVIEERRVKINQVNSLREERNRLTQEISMKKKQGEAVEPLLIKSREVSDSIKITEEELRANEDEEQQLLQWIPNITAEENPKGKDAVFKEVKEWGDKQKKNKNYYDICLEKGYVDFKRGAKIAASHFPLYVGKGAYLERILINFMIDVHRIKHGYEEVFPPFMVNRKSLFSTGQLPKMEDDMYKVPLDEVFMIPTAEVPVTNIMADEIIAENQLPVKYVAYSSCFRREAGSYGKDTKGLKRLHQFNKVELVKYSRDEESYIEHEKLLEDAESILRFLNLAYRVILLPDNDTSFASAKTYDIEVWAPASQEYLEVSSVSNFLDFQSRRANIRYRTKDGKNRFIHTLNGSGLATPRTVIAIMEQYQTEDGDFEFPPVLDDYINNGINAIKKL